MTGTRSRPSRSGPLFPRLDGLTVLLAEDDADARRITGVMLRQHGAEMIVAQDGLEALQVLGTARPDVALLDLLMPGLDGFGLAARLRADPRWQRLPVIAVTALGNHADYLRTWELDFAAHLTKPVDSAVLASTVLRVLGRVGRASVFDPRRASLALVFREAENALKTAASSLSDESARQALRTSVALTRQTGRAILARSAGSDGSAELRHAARGTLNVVMGWSRVLHAKRRDETAVLRAVEVIERSLRALAQRLDPADGSSHPASELS